MKNISAVYLMLLMPLLGCKSDKMDGTFLKQTFSIVDGEAVELYTIEFPSKLKATVTNYGGIVTSLYIPDKNGIMEDVVLGYDNLEGYLEQTPYFGALIGRYGNRIAKAKFSLNGEEHTLAVNNGLNHLHGGEKGFDKVIWEVTKAGATDEGVVIELQYVSPDGEEGYPGTLTSKVTYTFTANSFKIRYEASTSDQPTIVNLTQHTYFNLSGHVKESILNHELLLNASSYLPVDSTLIPIGEPGPVAGTPFDFTSFKRIGEEIGQEDTQLNYGGGYDHCWVLDGGNTEKVRKVGALYHPESGRFMEIHTMEPAIQFYSGNFLDGSITGKDDRVYEFRHGLCLETQHYPDSPNRPNFPSVVLNPGEKYETATEYVFSVK